MYIYIYVYVCILSRFSDSRACRHSPASAVSEVAGASRGQLVCFPDIGIDKFIDIFVDCKQMFDKCCLAFPWLYLRSP